MLHDGIRLWHLICWHIFVWSNHVQRWLQGKHGEASDIWAIWRKLNEIECEFDEMFLKVTTLYMNNDTSSHTPDWIFNLSLAISADYSILLYYCSGKNMKCKQKTKHQALTSPSSWVTQFSGHGTELSSFMASSTTKRLGDRFFWGFGASTGTGAASASAIVSRSKVQSFWMLVSL